MANKQTPNGFCLNNEKLDIRTTAIITNVSIYFFHRNSNQSELLIEMFSITSHYCHHPPPRSSLFPAYLCKNDNCHYNLANLWVDERQHPGGRGPLGNMFLPNAHFLARAEASQLYRCGFVANNDTFFFLMCRFRETLSNGASEDQTNSAALEWKQQ